MISIEREWGPVDMEGAIMPNTQVMSKWSKIAQILNYKKKQMSKFLKLVETAMHVAKSPY